MNTPPARATIWQVLLGTFVVLELTMMLLENAFVLLERTWPASVQAESVATVRLLPGNYTRVTGQSQSWGMFAPPPEHTAFPVVELYRQGADEPYATLMDPLRPDDLDAYFLPYGPGDRLCPYQAQMMFVAMLFESELHERPREVRDFVASKVREQWRMIRAYMRWRAGQGSEAEAPDSIVLAAELHATPRKGRQAVRWPYARWERSLEGSTEWLPILAYDPLEKRFRRLPITGPIDWDSVSPTR